MANILIVDDSFLARYNLKKILTDAGHKIVGEAENGLDGLVKFQLLSPDVVTMDITMPHLDGVSALKQIMEKKPMAKVIMITAIGQSNKVLECLKNGARNYITKPFEPKKVLDAIANVMDQA